MTQYGPFAAGIAIAGCLVLAFSSLILKMFGSATAWAAMAALKSPRVPMLAARVLGVVAIAATYIYVDSSNTGLFFLVAGMLAIIAVASVIAFNGMKERYVLDVPVVTSSGAQARDKKGNLIFTQILIGREDEMSGVDPLSWTG